MTVDVSELTAFATEFAGMAARVVAGAPAIVAKGALNIKTDARQALESTRSNRRLIGAMSYDMISTGTITEAEIGPDQSVSGLGVGREFGSTHTPPHPFLHPAFDAELPRFEAAVELLVAEVFR